MGKIHFHDKCMYQFSRITGLNLPTLSKSTVQKNWVPCGLWCLWLTDFFPIRRQPHTLLFGQLASVLFTDRILLCPRIVSWTSMPGVLGWQMCPQALPACLKGKCTYLGLYGGQYKIKLDLWCTCPYIPSLEKMKVLAMMRLLSYGY